MIFQANSFLDQYDLDRFNQPYWNLSFVAIFQTFYFFLDLPGQYRDFSQKEGKPQP